MHKNKPSLGLKRNSIIALLLLGPLTAGITWLVLIFYCMLYLANYMCHNFGISKIFCYIIAIFLTPIFIPLALISFLFSSSKEDKVKKVK